MDPAIISEAVTFSVKLAKQLFTTARDIRSRIKDDEEAMDMLKLEIVRAWMVYAKLFNIQLRKDIGASHQDLVKTFIIRLYDIEDLIDTEELTLALLKDASFLDKEIARASKFTRQEGHPHHVKEQEKRLEDRVSKWENILTDLEPENRYVSTSSSSVGRVDDINERAVMNPELIRCLAYYSLFPSNHGFDKDDLAHLWVGECFIQMDKKSTIMQHVEKYVNDLIEKSTLHSGQGYNLQYFAMLAASGTCLHLEQGDPSLSSLNNEVRHLSLSCEFHNDIWTTLKNLSIKLRTFLSLYSEHNFGLLGEIPKELKNSLSLLRVLSLRGTNVKQLPVFVSKLQHLRYLDVSFTTIEELPTKFRINYPLQFLKIKKCTKLSKWLTSEVHKLTFLRYVDWEEGFLRETEVPRHIGNLTHLENLPVFRVGSIEGRLISELERMDHLQGSICIENLESVEELNQKILDANNACKLAAQKAKLHRKCGLRRVVLQWNSKKASRCDLSEGILTGLKPHSNVKELKIINYVGVKFPEWMPSSVLEKIELKECFCCDISALGKMKNLKTLVLTDMESKQVHLRPYGEANTGACFQKLELMEFHNLNKLEEWTGFQPGDLPCLMKLKFVGCKLIHSELQFIEDLKRSNPSVLIPKDHFNDPNSCLLW